MAAGNGQFTASFESLRRREIPDWFRDAKFGIWSHWGPQSVPMFGDWYARHMYLQGHPQYHYHLRHYGHPSEFGYKDLVKLWKAERFDPDGLMALYKKAGARYFVGQAMHHDHFFNYGSKLNRFNSVDVGPGKDICALWKKAAVAEGLPFGLTEHLGATFSWWKLNKHSDATGPMAGVPYDGNDPEYKDFYLENQEHVSADHSDVSNVPWYTTNSGFHDYWLRVMHEVIDLFKPDLLYSDGPIPFGKRHESDTSDPLWANGLDAIAHLYNTSAVAHGSNRAVYCQKDRREEIANVGVLDIEKSQLPDIHPEPWQTDTCIGGWFYDADVQYKQPQHLIEMLIDIVAKNGNMLLNILQRPDGTIDDEANWILAELGSWFEICGESIYGTRPWRVSGEGPSSVLIDGFAEDQVGWKEEDIRFTQKAGTLYAFLMRAPVVADGQRVAVVRSLRESDAVRSVRLLGHGPVEFTQNFGVVTVRLPADLPTSYTNVLAIEIGS